MRVDILIPQEDVNTEFVMLNEWLVEHLAPVRQQQPICLAETSKAVFEITAPSDGILVHLVEAVNQVAVGAPVGLVVDSVEEAARVLAETPDAPPSLREDAIFSPTRKAVAVAERHGLDLSTAFTGWRGFLTEADVLDLLQRRQGEETGPETDSLQIILKDVRQTGVTLPAHARDEEIGKLDPAFYAALQRDPAAFRALDTREKIARYRDHGAVIGENVTLGAGTSIIAPQIILEDGVEIMDGGDILCAEKLAIGELSHFGPNLELACRRAILGMNIYGGRNIRIGGGGHRDPWAVCLIGDSTFLGDDLFINPCRPILIGQEVFLTQRAILVTHNVGHSIFDGYENRFAPIVVEDCAQVGMQCTLYAGVRIGRGAIVGSNSYVVSSIPPGKFALGVPARVQSDAARPLTNTERADRARKMLDEYYHLLDAKGYAVTRLDAPHSGFTLEHEGRQYAIYFTEELKESLPEGTAEHDNGNLQLPQEALPPLPFDELIILTFAAPTVTPEANCAIIDLQHKTITGAGGIFLESTREFLRKRGLRCTPQPWRYRGGFV